MGRPNSRRMLLACLALLMAGGISLWYFPVFRPALTEPNPTTPAAALAELRAGNLRYVRSQRVLSTDTAHDAEDRHRLAREQHPFAAVLTCADSRICPEFIFDQRIGRIFEIRNAGNLVDDDVMASFEYAIEHLHVPLVLVLGHKGCGAIAAVHEADGKPLHDHLKALQEHMAGIKEEIHRTHGDHSTGLLNRLARENTRQQALTLLRESEPLRAALRAGHVRLAYAMYDMETGEVEFCDEAMHE